MEVFAVVLDAAIWYKWQVELNQTAKPDETHSQKPLLLLLAKILHLQLIVFSSPHT